MEESRRGEILPGAEEEKGEGKEDGKEYNIWGKKVGKEGKEPSS